MAKNPTSWSNNDAKPPANWLPVTKQKAVWSNNITKKAAKFTPVVKGNTAWSSVQSNVAPWTYDSATQKYDDTPLRGYDLLTPTTNTINNKVPTAWAAVV